MHRKLIFTLLLACVGCASASAQFNPPPIAGFVNPGTGWTPLTGNGDGTAVSFNPPPAAIYTCVASSGGVCTSWQPWTGAGGGGGSGTVTSVTFTGDGTVLSSTPSSAVTTSGTVTATLATQTANTVLGALTATTPSDLALPSCSTSTDALNWTSGTGFGCVTFGTAALNNTGTSGATIPLLNGINTWSNAQTVTASITSNGMTVNGGYTLQQATSTAINNAKVELANSIILGWSSTSANSGIIDTTLCREAAGEVEVGSATGCANSGIFDAAGYRIANAATSGNYLRGNGTSFVSNTIQTGDLPALGAATATSLIASGVVDGESIVNVSTGSTLTFGTTGTACSSCYYDNEEATAGQAITATLPTAAAGLQYCIDNSYNGSAPNTGTLEILTSASGQFIIYTDGTLSATGGYVISGGAARDSACVRGVDSTHWMLYIYSGTWTKH